MLLILGTLYGVFRPAPFFRAYLIAFEFCLGLSLGCMVVMMIRHLTGGAGACTCGRSSKPGRPSYR